MDGDSDVMRIDEGHESDDDGCDEESEMEESEEESDAEEWLAVDGGNFCRMNMHLDEPRRQIQDAAFDLQSLQVGNQVYHTQDVLRRIGSPPASSPLMEGQSPSSRIKKARRHEEELATMEHIC